MSDINEAPLLAVERLTIDLITERESVRAVDTASYQVDTGETLAIVGESGSGKTILNFAPLGLVPVGVHVETQGSARFGGVDLLAAPDMSRSLLGSEIGVVFQDPMSALNPARRIGSQIAEVATHRMGLSKRAAADHALELVKIVGLSDPRARLDQFPHELSGGMRQRVMIAIAIAAEPRLLIADEPTTALDVTVQAQILELLAELQDRLGMTLVLITHDMGVVARMATRVAVMRHGRILEQGTVDRVLLNPSHPYTIGLLDALPRPGDVSGTPFRGLPEPGLGNGSESPEQRRGDHASDHGSSPVSTTSQPGHFANDR